MELKSFFVQDDQGNKLGGATCYLYARGTESQVEVLQKANGIPLLNPFLSDPDGQVQLAAPNGLYDLRVVAGARDYRLSIQFNDVSDSVASALVAANRAESARDAAHLARGMATTKEQGLVKTVPGEYFSVPSAENNQLLILYLNDSGVAKEVDRYANAGTTQSALETARSAYHRSIPGTFATEMPWAVTDESRNPILGVRKDGVAHAVLDQLPGLSMLSDYSWAVTDTTGVVLLGIKWSGKVTVYGLDSAVENLAYTDGPDGGRDVFTLVDGIPYQLTSSGDNYNPTSGQGTVSFLQRKGPVSHVTVDIPVSGSIASFVTEILHILSFGQSLSMGSGSALTTFQPPVANRLLTLQDGVRLANQDGTLTSSMIAPFKPLNGKTTEIPAVQMAAQINRLRGLPENAGLLVSAHGRGGYTIKQLSKGTLFYSNLMTAVVGAKTECDARTFGYKVPFVDWIQGEADRNAAPGIYLADLLQIQSDLETDINGETAKTGRVPMLLDQIGNWTAYGLTESNVPHDQLQAALDYPDRFTCAGPKYWAQTNAADGVHLPASSSMRVGAMHARAAKAIINGNAWKPTHCVSAIRSGVNVTLNYHVPFGSLTVDTVAVSDPGNWGLRWIDSTMSATVVGVKLVGDNKVMLTLSNVPTGNDSQVGIADIGIANQDGGPFTGARSCLRDSSSDLDSYGMPVYNWACHQRISVQ